MAVYQYECKACNHQYEVTQKITDDKLTEHHCDNCGDVQPCIRIIVSANFKLLGEGWAKDGYSKDTDYVKEMM